MNLKQKANLILKSNYKKEEKIKNLIFLVMNIPYKRIGSLNPTDMIIEWKWSCTPKHIFLASCFKKLNIEFKYLIIPFFYKKSKIKFPKEYENIVNDMPISYHVALNIKINNKWIIIDSTWDSLLKKFPHNKKWNWLSDMILAVEPEKIIERISNPRVFEKRMWNKYTKNELQKRKEFYKFYDKFLIETRKND